LALARWIVHVPFDRAIDFLIGFTLAFHYIGLAKEFHLRQTDITETGLMVSVCVTGAMNLVILALILGVMLGDWIGLLHYVESSLRRTLESYQVVISFIRPYLLALGR
jgi:hypothetical protein